jgi:hypothetical protein
VARVRLPDFYGLDAGDKGVGALLAPLWLKSSDEAWDTRQAWTWPENQTGLNWWETNIEFWRERGAWQAYADANLNPAPPELPATGGRFVSAGNSWWRYSSAFYPALITEPPSEPRPANAAFGPCIVTTEGNEIELADQSACLDAMIGRSTHAAFDGLGHPYVYVIFRHTGEATDRYLYVRLEDEHGQPVAGSGFQSLLLDQIGQSNFIDPGFFSAQLEMLLYRVNDAEAGTIEDPAMEMFVDWFLYIRDTDIGVEAAADLARSVKRRLSEYNESLPERDQVWRVNTTDLLLSAPRRSATDPPDHPPLGWATCNPWAVEPTNNWDFHVEKTDRNNGQTYFTVHLDRGGHQDPPLDLRSIFQSVRWDVVRNGSEVAGVTNEGYALRWGAWGTAPVEIKATITQTSPIVCTATDPPVCSWAHSNSTACPEYEFGPATRTHTYLYNPVTGEFSPIDSWGPPDAMGRNAGAPTELVLEPPYPNPFELSTTFRLGMPQRGDVNLAVFDVLGRQVALVTSDELEAGWHTLTLDSEQFASGVYVYRLRSGDEVRTGKMLHVR